MPSEVEVVMPDDELSPDDEAELDRRAGLLADDALLTIQAMLKGAILGDQDGVGQLLLTLDSQRVTALVAMLAGLLEATMRESAELMELDYEQMVDHLHLLRGWSL